jgi:small subunit ribosomal protein S20
MPIKQNAKKYMRQASKRAERNLIVKTTYKKAVKTARELLAAGQQDVKEQIRLAQKALDKASKRGVIKANTAGRKLSRLMKKAKKVVKK